MVSITGGKRGLVVGRWICNPEVSGSNPTPCHWMDLSSVAPNSYSPRCVNSQLVRLPPVGILNLLCLICIVFVCYAHLNIFTWNLRDINVHCHCHYYYYLKYFDWVGSSSSNSNSNNKNNKHSWLRQTQENKVKYHPLQFRLQLFSVKAAYTWKVRETSLSECQPMVYDQKRGCLWPGCWLVASTCLPLVGSSDKVRLNSLF